MGYFSYLGAWVVALFLPVSGYCGAPPATGGHSDLQFAFATCVGRYSALLEHQWLTGPQRSDETQQLQRELITLLEAVTPPEAKRQALSQRIQAKRAFATMLTRIRMARDPAYTAWASRRAEADIAACRALLLGPLLPRETG